MCFIVGEENLSVGNDGRKIMGGDMAAGLELGKQIRKHRLAVEMQISQLAKILGVSRNTIANYENGKTEPATGDLSRIANALGCRIVDFFSEEAEALAPRFAFRAHKALKKNTSLTVAARKYLQAYAEIEKITGTRLLSKYRQFEFEPDETPLEQWIEMAADKTREICGSRDGGPENIVSVLENLGIRSLFFQTDADGLDGLSARQGDMSLIMIREREQSIERTIFSAVHELAHLVLHPHLFTISSDRNNDERDYEKEANLFAGCYLVPTGDLIELWNEERLNKLPLVHALILLKKAFRVSFWCLYERIKQLGLAELEYPKLIIQTKRLLNIRGKAKMEELEPDPLPKDMLQESTRFARLVRSAYIQENLGIAKVAELFQVTVDRAKEITAKWMAPQSEMVA